MNSSQIIEPAFYECEYCLKKLARKSAFEKHECESMKRHRLCKTKRGVNAFNDYSYWLSLKGNKVKKISTFVSSKFFTSFMEFQKFCSDKGIPDKKLYIKYMTERGISPMLWRQSEVYNFFINYFDSEVSPMKKVKITLRTLNSISEIFECKIDKVFKNLLPSEVARLIFERRLSPWLLLFSPSFKMYMHEIKNPSQYIMITNVIDAATWKDIFRKHPEEVKQIKQLIVELGL